MVLTLTGIACALGGRVRGNKVVAPGPEAASKTGYKRRKSTLTVWINADCDIGVNSWRGQDPIATKDWVRARCGLPTWEPKKRKAKPLPPLAERSQFLGEVLKIARDRKRITFEQFALIINDLKNACPDATLKTRAGFYAREFWVSAPRRSRPLCAPNGAATGRLSALSSSKSPMTNIVASDYAAPAASRLTRRRGAAARRRATTPRGEPNVPPREFQ